MNRLLLAGVTVFVLLSLGIWIYSAVEAPSATDYGVARGRSLLNAENYLGALESVRSLPEKHRTGADIHTLLGTAYLRLHLYLAAIKEFEDAERQGSRRADPWLGLASSYIELGDGKKALDEANQAISVEPRSADAWIMLGRAHWLQQDYPEAEKAALKAQSIEPGLPVTTELLLHIYFDQEQPEKFETVFDRIQNPSKGVQDLAVRFYVRQGAWLKAYEVKTRFERSAVQKAILETELTLNREPQRADLYPGLIRNLVKDGRYREAIETARRYNGTVHVDLELGKAYWMTGQRDAAIQAFQHASSDLVHKLSAEVALAILTGDIRHWREAYKAERLEQDHFILGKLEALLPPAPPVIRTFVYRYAGTYDINLYDKAVEQAQKVLTDDPRNLDALLSIATAYHRLGKVKDAKHYVELTTEYYPKEAEAWARLASLAIEQRDPNETLKLMMKAVELAPRNAGNLYNLGWMFDQLGDVPRAIDLYQRAIQASPITFEAMNNLALIYEQTGQPERALDLLQRAIRVDPDIDVGYFNLGNHYVRQREWKEALETYDKVLQINPASAAAAVEKGRIYVQTGQSAAAVEALNRALEFDAHSFDAYLLLSSAYEKLNHAKEAVAAAEEAQRIRTDAPEVRATLDRLKNVSEN